jgi:antirestriction protein ArdC
MTHKIQYLFGRTLNLDERNAEAQDCVTATGADFREGQGEPYYAAGREFISMPTFEAFKDADCFYATSFHELGHNAEPSVMPRRSRFTRKTRANRRWRSA